MKDQALSTQLTQLVEEASKAWAAASTVDVQDQVRATYLGKSGRLAEFTARFQNSSAEQKRSIGGALATAKEQLRALMTLQRQRLPLDVTLPGYDQPEGALSPVLEMMDELVRTMQRLGFSVAGGPEIVRDSENFTALNLGPDHPARDEHDSFYLDEHRLLRTQMTTADVGAITAELTAGRVPVRLVLPGRVFRREADTTHAPAFHQLDAVYLGDDATFSQLKGVLEYLVQQTFGKDVMVRFRPHHFPFTEPSAEIDLSWGVHEDGSPRWLELGGCGMLHPHVVERTGANPQVLRGWAFGLGIERPVLVRHGIDSLKRFTHPDRRYLDQFAL